MSVHTVLQYSPTTSNVPDRPRRPILPSLARNYLTGFTVILPKTQVSSSTETGSPVTKRREDQVERNLGENITNDHFGSILNNRRTENQFDVQLGKPNADFTRVVKMSKRITLAFKLLENGRYIGPPKDGFNQLASLFPTTFAVGVRPPFLLFRVRTIPPKPWPISVAGLPPRFTTDEHQPGWNMGKVGTGPKLLLQYNLQRKDEFSDKVLKDAINSLIEQKLDFIDLRWYGAFWVVSLPGKETSFQKIPSFLAGQGCYYRFSESEDCLPAALQGKPPTGIQYDNTIYADEVGSILRPGIIVSSSVTTSTVDGKEIRNFKSTTSGLMVVNQDGDKFITIAAHGFEQDGLVWHPNPHHGKIIGNIVESIPDADIAIVKLNKGLRYTNHTFGTAENPGGKAMVGISPNYPPHTLIGDIISMDNPYSGFCEGQIVALGAKIGNSGKHYIPHTWTILQSGEEVVDGSCGSVILDDDGRVVGFFRYMSNDGTDCYTVSATELRENGYEICGGIQTW